MFHKSAKKIKASGLDRFFVVINYFLLFILFIVFLAPLMNVAASSLSAPSQLTTGNIWLLPKDLSFDAYDTLIGISDIWRGYRNSFVYMMIGTAVNLVMTVLAAYPLSKKFIRGRKLIMALFTVTMFFGGGLIPTFLLVRSLGLINTVWALCLPGAISVSNMIVARTFFSTSIPQDLYDAADIDGANDLVVLLRIALPLSVPILAVMVLWYAVGHWNSYFSALIYINDYHRYPLQMIIRDYLMNDNTLEQMLDFSAANDTKAITEMMGKREVLKYAIIVVSSLPMLLLYPFIQKHFVKGVMIGSLKG